MIRRPPRSTRTDTLFPDTTLVRSIQQLRVGAYIMKQRFRGNSRYPLVLMLEPLFRCNLACPGCGTLDYPDEILHRRLSVAECIYAVEARGAPLFSLRSEARRLGPDCFLTFLSRWSPFPYHKTT